MAGMEAARTFFIGQKLEGFNRCYKKQRWECFSVFHGLYARLRDGWKTKTTKPLHRQMRDRRELILGLMS